MSMRDAINRAIAKQEAELCKCGHMKVIHVHVGTAAAGCSITGCKCYVYEEKKSDEQQG